MESFNEFLTEVKEGREFLNEGTLPNKLVNSLIRQATWSLNNGSNGCLSVNPPTLESIAFAMGIEGDANLAENTEVIKMFEAVQGAYVKAKTSFLTTLNKELKSIK